MAPGSTEQVLEEKIARMIDQLDDLVAMAANPDTCGMIAAEALAVGQIYSRAALLRSFLLATQTPMLKVVKNG